jgi:hypothetical protein
MDQDTTSPVEDLAVQLAPPTLGASTYEDIGKGIIGDIETIVGDLEKDL